MSFLSFVFGDKDKKTLKSAEKIVATINGLEKELAFKVLKTAAYKLPVKTKIVTRGNL